MSEVKDKCPKCGAEVASEYSHVSIFECGSDLWKNKIGLAQSPRCRIAELEAALKPFAKIADEHEKLGWNNPEYQIWPRYEDRKTEKLTEHRVNLETCRAASRALASTEKGEG